MAKRKVAWPWLEDMGNGLVRSLQDNRVYRIICGDLYDKTKCNGVLGMYRYVDINDRYDPEAHMGRRMIELGEVRTRLEGLPAFDAVVEAYTGTSWGEYSSAIEAFLAHYAETGARVTDGGRVTAALRYGDPDRRVERDEAARKAAEDMKRRNPHMSQREVCRRIGAALNVSRETVRRAIKKK